MSPVRELTVEGRDGAVLPARVLQPVDADEARPGVLVPDVGPGDAARWAAVELAGAGYPTLWVDLGEREGGGSTGADLPDRRTVAELDEAARVLGAQPEVVPDRIAALGIGLGGKLVFLLGCQSRRLTAVVDLCGPIRYGELDADHPVQPLEMALGLECPLLAVFGAEDPATPSEDVEALGTQLDAFAKSFSIEVVPDVGRGFLDQRDEHEAEAAKRVWTRVHAFLAENL